jgi:hypothetical protein
MAWRRRASFRADEKGVHDAQLVDALVMLQVFGQQQRAALLLGSGDHQRVPVVQPKRLSTAQADSTVAWSTARAASPGSGAPRPAHRPASIGGESFLRGVGIELVEHLGLRAAAAPLPAGASQSRARARLSACARSSA